MKKPTHQELDEIVSYWNNQGILKVYTFKDECEEIMYFTIPSSRVDDHYYLCHREKNEAVYLDIINTKVRPTLQKTELLLIGCQSFRPVGL
jgi:hypothetical protein